MLCTDATHKLTFHNYPVLPLGLADYHNHTFPIALGLCGHERAADYKELLRSMDIGALRMGLLAHSPQFVMADGDPAITAAVNEVFPNAGRSMCWFHMKRNVEDYMEKDLKMDDDAIFPIMRDLAYIQLAVTEQAFTKMFELFNELYKDDHPSLLAYIRRQWMENPPYNSWYEGFAPRLPSTNNSLESMNNQLKIKVLREKLPLGSFIAKITQKIVYEYSLALDSDLGTTDRVFEHIDEVKVPKTLFASAARWASAEPMHIIRIPSTGGAYAFVRSRGASASYLNLDHIHQYLGTLFGTYEHQDFASMAGMISKIYMITIPPNVSNWRHFYCTCPSFLKNKTCFHCIGIGSRQGLLNQEDRFSMPIQRNPRRQRRASKARKALSRSLTLDAAAQDRFHHY
ncbi:hypothetical protein FOL47_007369 [Perkinsus chesapeaki]|uniref:SWIM-type domain-containing protein n=1 Tax=Perkinsus chesapeaki TaxID=330153 RepID=A0A7J6LLB0_PERCH|nr:hypothetical protein FOL47_007369 [Perkinsus chesapeaki]